MFTAIIGNSQTIAIGDAIIAGTGSTTTFVYGSGTASTAVAQPTKVLGVCVGFLPINQTGGANATQELSSYAASSSNQTTGGQIRAKFIPARMSNLWVADLFNSATTGTTTGSAGFGYMNIETNSTLKEASFVAPVSTVSTYTGSTLSFASYGTGNNFGPQFTTSQVIGYFNLYV